MLWLAAGVRDWDQSSVAGAYRMQPRDRRDPSEFIETVLKRRHGFKSFVPQHSKVLYVLESRIHKSKYGGPLRGEPVDAQASAEADATVLATSLAARSAAATSTPAVLSGDYVACAAFAGARAGYVFRAGRRGVGYYIDSAVRADLDAEAQVRSAVLREL